MEVNALILGGSLAERLRREREERGSEIGERQHYQLEGVSTPLLAPVEDGTVLTRLVKVLQKASRIKRILVVTNNVAEGDVRKEAEACGLASSDVVSNGISEGAVIGNKNAEMVDLQVAIGQWGVGAEDDGPTLVVSGEHFFVPEFRMDALIERMALSKKDCLACYRAEEPEAGQMLPAIPQPRTEVEARRVLKPLNGVAKAETMPKSGELLAAPIALLHPGFHQYASSESTVEELACSRGGASAVELGFGHLDVRSLDGCKFAHALLMHEALAKRSPAFRSKSRRHVDSSLSHLFQGDTSQILPDAERIVRPSPPGTSLSPEGQAELERFSRNYHARRSMLKGKGATQTNIPASFYTTTYARQAGHTKGSPVPASLLGD